ncbi:hypothetical protein R5H30_01515 [Sulfitobacter sp. D35]|uniref:hypothetical protein n=1 Tax=Sulfitobacter sp. D35 TaxID=3083252 RepID=UPI00296E48CA|nr:hypothetical protein [Sulfitobacter sp. D35]MDW4496643.1 hypothetical protein [Sulfitobacter sp. D35]
MTSFERRGWAVFPSEPATVDWARHALEAADAAVSDPGLADMLQCEGTWFVGLEALPNDAAGAVGASGPLRGEAAEAAGRICGGMPALHRAQLSITYPGYPRRRHGESDAAFRYRRDRDAAHVDGVLGVGTPKRRFVREPHAFILGIMLTEADAGAAPLVAWEGSHRVMREAFRRAFAGQDAQNPGDVDVTEAYVAARRVVFETCRRVVLTGPPGTGVLLHRLTLHGVAPWADGAQADPRGRAIAYFRPAIDGDVAAWLAAS